MIDGDPPELSEAWRVVGGTELVTNPAEENDRFRNEIPGSSDKASKITGVMEEIAFQTNLLALHAALAAPSGKISQDTPASSAPPTALGHRAASQEKKRKDSEG